ncbi:aldehyde dehydrogenase [Cutibacterium sp.]|uniref:aldehyde dehydrogenase n=1 Tax=Cutibacterium sp. TaxID=1912221 RepID=UPI0026DCAD7A|nr:aldehyde dehydrogenase [Cutibacterium sp.]MDO4412759.1 aldehyde dehydrogenase [Cutibacterium sp.]
MVTTYSNWIAGEFRDSADLLDVVNPATDEVIARVPRATEADVDDAMSAAWEARKSWALTPASQRAAFVSRMAAGVRENRQMFIDTLVAEQSKTPELAAVEVDFTADYLDYTAGWALRIEGEVLESDRPHERILMLRKPLGVAVGILPWNFPFFLIARKLAPALVTGNTAVIKPASDTPINALQFATMISDYGLPKGVVSILSASGKVASKMAGDPRAGIVSFTGSVPVGKQIMSAASNNVTKVSLELGGKAPAIVLDDADLDLAVKAIHGSRVINAGQVCNNAERVYVTRGVADEFISRMTDAMAATKVGVPGVDEGLDMGAQINAGAVDRIEAMVQRAVEAGAIVTTGGGRDDRGKGAFFRPTVLTDVKQDSEIIQEEIFGPVLPIVVVDDFDEAIAKANDSDFGLTSSLYTRDLAAAMKGMREIDFGETYINRENFEAMQGFHAGTRRSGIGGADGKHGLYEYTRTQVVYIEA